MFLSLPVLNPCDAKPNAALKPAPPAPTTTASYSCVITGYERDGVEDGLPVIHKENERV